MLRFATVLIAALALAPAAQAQAIQPGTYDLQIAFGGGILEGTLRVASPRRDSLEVTLHIGDHQSPIRLTRREGSKLILDSTVPGMQIHYELDFRGDAVTGPFTYNGDNGTVSGRRRAG